MGKTRDLFKKIKDTKGTFHAKMSSIKDRNGMDLREAEDIKKRWQEYTEELYKKNLHNPDQNGVITDLEPDILECGRPGVDPWVGKIPLEKEMATHSSTLSWRITWMEEPCRLQSMGSQRVIHD